MRNWFSNLKFRYKLLIGMIAITTAALLLISQLSYSYFYKRNTREVLKKQNNRWKLPAPYFPLSFSPSPPLRTIFW